MNKFSAVFAYHLCRPQSISYFSLAPLYHSLNRYCTVSQKEECNTIKDVPGLSDKVVCVPSEDVGPGASKSKEYKNPEYFCYDKLSFFEAEIEMSCYRLPQPSSLKK